MDHKVGPAVLSPSRTRRSQAAARWISTCQNPRLPCRYASACLLLALPTTQEWGEARGEGPSQFETTRAPPLPVPLLHPLEERECLVAACWGRRALPSSGSRSQGVGKTPRRLPMLGLFG